MVDEIERLAIARAKALFGTEHANVQADSGSSANFAVLQALCAPGDCALGWDFAHGGHPSHYAPETVSGRFSDGHACHVRREDRLVDLDEVAELARRHRPKVIFVGWSCDARHVDYGAFRAIADEVGAFLVADMARIAGLVAAGLHPDPVGVRTAPSPCTRPWAGRARAPSWRAPSSPGASTRRSSPARRAARFPMSSPRPR